MATSGTVGRTVITTAEFIEQALTMCGLKAAQITPEIVRKAKITLFMYLSALVNDGVNLWTIEEYVIGLIPGQQRYALPKGSVDELNVNYRKPYYANNSNSFESSDGGITQYLIDDDVDTVFTQNSKNGNIKYDFGQNNGRVMYFMLMAYGQKYFSLTAQVSNDGISWTDVQTFDQNIDCPDLQWVYFPIETPRIARFFRVVETGGETISLRLLTFTVGTNDISVQRVNLPDYANMTDKTQQGGEGGQTTMYWVDRRLNHFDLVIWPVSNVAINQLSVYYHRQIQDVGSLKQSLEIPDRWWLAVLEGFALKSLFQVEGADLSRFPALKDQARESLTKVENEERDKAPQQMLPNIGGYTR